MQSQLKKLLGLVLVIIAVFEAAPAQTTNLSPLYARSFLDTPALINSAYAQTLVFELLQTPVGEPVIPEADSRVARMNPGTYWSLQKPNQPPWPGRFFPELPAYELAPGHFLVDDRTVDYPTLHVLRELEAEANGQRSMMVMGAAIYDYGDTTNLWLEIPQDGVISNEVNVILHNTIEGLPYTLLTKTDLNLPTWTAEQVTTGAVGNATMALLAQNDRTNLFIWARSGTAATITILTQPLSQTVMEWDTVAFEVVATGSGTLSYQWFYGGTSLPGATSRRLVRDNVLEENAGVYSVAISDGTNTVVSTPATLSVILRNPRRNDPYYMYISGDRQNYTFKDGVTYEIDGPVNLYGTTTLKGGSVLKLDWASGDATLRVLGDLVCDTASYYPAILTSVDDDSAGYSLGYSYYDGPPQCYEGTAPYLDLSQSTSVDFHDVRIAYADSGVLTPSAGLLEVWHSQFLQCNWSITNQAGGHVGLHNVLFANCGTVVSAGTNHFSIAAEQVTSDATNFWSGLVEPDFIAITNTLHTGAFLTCSNQFFEQAGFGLGHGSFETNGAGNYYLPKNSVFHQAGSANISPALLAAFKTKSTYAPIVIPSFTTLRGEVALFPQTPRYTNGAPDLGYHYDVLDYTIGGIVLAGGTLSIMPGTAVGLHQEYSDDKGWWTLFGFDVRENAKLISCGQPERPVILTDAQLVQEQFLYSCLATVVPDFWPVQEGASPPTLDFRFTQFYAGAGRDHVWAGYDAFLTTPMSPCALMNWSMQDCVLRGGNINLGAPDDGFFGIGLGYYYGAGTVDWRNNLFEAVSINLNPTAYWLDGFVNCDLVFTARNNLFRDAKWFLLAPIPASAGNWTLRDNHFAAVQFSQYLDAPLDFDHNAYWPPFAAGQLWPGYTNCLQLPNDTNSVAGAGEVLAAGQPAYQAGPYGKHYLPQLTPLYHAGSRTAADAGLSQYTQRPDQFTAGQDYQAFTGNVNIGLHYVATTNASSTLPKDTDGDGVPDFVEDANGNNVVDANETSPALAQTVSGINDATNSVYDDIDLSGNGLVGRIKRALGLNPLDKNNPLTLKEVAFDEEWGIATFEVPVSFNVITNLGRLHLEVDGGQFGNYQDFIVATNGNCLLRWNTTFDPIGVRICQPKIVLNGNRGGGNHVTTEGLGVFNLLTSTNFCRFDPFYTEFTEMGATLYTQLSEPTADYTIELKDSDGRVLKSINGNTADGEILESWDLTDSNGNVVTNDEIKVVFQIVLSGNRSGSAAHSLFRAPIGIWNDGDFTVAYAWDDAYQAQNAMRFAIQYGVVDTLTAPDQSGMPGNPNPYNSVFNEYTWSGNLQGEAGWLSSMTDVTALTNNLAQNHTRNFYFDGHGSDSTIGNSYAPDQAGSVTIAAVDIAAMLHNWITASKRKNACLHPYRFVFLNACDTADYYTWAWAFGIPENLTYERVAERGYAQAFVG